MKRVFAVLMILSVLTMTGCANGPIRNFFRGAACHWCGTAAVAPCDTCNTGSHTSFAPGYDAPVMPGTVESLPDPGQIGPTNK